MPPAARPVLKPDPELADGRERRRLEKQRVILDAAAEVFMRDGFGGASVDDIVAASGVSKRTLYAHFDSKQALFAAIVREWCDALLVPLREPEIAERTPEATLKALGRKFLDVILSPDGVRLYRIVVAESPRFPELGRAFYEAGHAPCSALLTGYLERLVANGTLRPIDARRSAEGFFQFITGFGHERLLLSLDDTIEPTAVDAYLDVTVDVFLRGVYTRPEPEPKHHK